MLEELNNKAEVADKELRKLKSGRDAFTLMTKEEILADITEDVIRLVNASLDVAYRMRTFRWILRGLKPELAVRKMLMIQETEKLRDERFWADVEDWFGPDDNDNYEEEENTLHFRNLVYKQLP